MKNFLKLNQDARLDEIVFANRNKEYGAYALRREESAVLKKSLFLGVSLFVVIGAVPLVMNALRVDTVYETPITGPGDMIPIPDIPDKTEPEPVQPQQVKPTETFVSTVPTPTKNPPVETPSPTVSKYDDAVAGFEERDGEKPTVNYTPPVTHPVVPTPVVPADPPKEKSDEPFTNVDVQANFAGGINAFRTKIGQNFDLSLFEGSGETMTANVTFIVEKDGTISNVKANGTDARFNKEAERTVKSVKGKWQPAKLKGEVVRSYFRVPITIQFE